MTEAKAYIELRFLGLPLHIEATAVLFKYS